MAKVTKSVKLIKVIFLLYYFIDLIIKTLNCVTYTCCYLLIIGERLTTQHWWNEPDRGEQEVSEKNLFHCHFVYTNST
jgi:hypothetical protein